MRLLLFFWLLLAIFGGISRSEAAENGRQGKVVVLKIGEEDLVNPAAFRFYRNEIQRAKSERAQALVLEINTPGGLLQETAELIVKDLQQLDVPSYAWVNQKALSAGALIAFGCDKIYMHPVSSIGAAGIVQADGRDLDATMKAKVESSYEATMVAVAEKKGHDPNLVRAMMFAEREFDFGVIAKVAKGELLTLTASQASSQYQGKNLLATGLVSSVSELLEREKLTGEILVIEPQGFELLAWWIARFSFLLIVAGLFFAFLEFKIPGFGWPGILSVTCFGLLFFANHLAGHLAGSEHIVLFVLGIGLILVEIFILPGFGVAGILGGVLLIISLFGAMIEPEAMQRFQSESWTLASFVDLIQSPLRQLSLGIIGACALILLSIKYLPDLTIFRGLMLTRQAPSGSPPQEVSSLLSLKPELGSKGLCVTDLRPVGKADFQGRVFEVSLNSGFLAKGSWVEVVMIAPMHTEVVACEEPSNQA